MKCLICGKKFIKRRVDSVCCSNGCKNLRASRRYSERKRLGIAVKRVRTSLKSPKTALTDDTSC